MTEDPLAKRPADQGAGQPPPPPYGENPPQAYGQPGPDQPPYGYGQPSYGQPVPGFGAPPAGAYFVSMMGQEQGPYPLGQLAQMATSGQLKPDVMVRADNGGQWFPAKEVPGLFSDKEWLVALLLAVFLGAFAVDRFYVGQTGTAIAKLVVSLVTCFVGGLIWQVVDIILIATRKLPDGQGRPLR